MPIYALPYPIYQPAMRVILSITNSFPAIVVTSIDGINPADNDYISGMIVRLDIPKGYGMNQAHNRKGTITVINPTTFSIDIDTTLFDIFVVPTSWPLSYQKAQVVPVGEVNDMLTAATRNIL
jgi:hypothetical protein